MFPFTLLLLLIPIAQPFNLKLFPTAAQTQSIPIFQNNLLSSQFNDSTESNKLSCSAGNLYILQRKQPDNQMPALFYSNILFQPNDINFTCSPNKSPCPSVVSIATNVLNVELGCPVKPTDADYYNKVQCVLTSDDQIWRFSFMLDCDQGDRHKRFEFGYLIIAAANLVVIVAVALHSRLWSYKWNNTEVGIQATWKGVLILVVVMVGLVVLLVKLDKITGAATVLGSIIGPVFLMISFNQAFFLLKPLRKTICAPIRYCDILSLISASAILAITIIYKDFISNAIIAGGIIITSIKLFKFTSLKEAAIGCGILMVVETLAAVIYHETIPDQSYNDAFGRDIVSPILIQFPSLTQSLYKKCSWVAVTEIIFPGMTISYLRRFQFAREGRRPYLFVSNFAFFVSTVVWLFFEAVYAHTLPFALITYPITFASVIVLANFCMNQFKVIWNGTWEDPEFKDNQAYKGILKPEQNSDHLDQNLFQGMRASQIKFSSDLSSKSGKQTTHDMK